MWTKVFLYSFYYLYGAVTIHLMPPCRLCVPLLFRLTGASDHLPIVSEYNCALAVLSSKSNFYLATATAAIHTSAKIF